VAEHTGREASKLYKIPEIEPELLYLWGYYCNIKGHEPLTFVELEAWQRVTGKTLTPGEADLLFLIDSAFYKVQQKSE